MTGLWGVYSFRSTRDIDLLGFGDSDLQALEAVFREMCQVEVEDDGIIFDKDSVKAEDIRDQLEYGGTRIRFTADLGGAQISLQVDVDFDGVVANIANFIMPLIEATRRSEIFAAKWLAGGPWQLVKK